MNQDTIIVGLGEILWDVFPDGPRFGGAPANFACSAAALSRPGVRVWMASCVGRDELGDRAMDSLREKSVDTACVARADQPTGQVLVQLDTEGSARYEFAAETAWDNFQWTDELGRLAARTRACCFGTLGQRSAISRRTIQSFVSKMPATALRIFDVNLRPPFFSDSVILESLSLANVLKLNEEELPVLASLGEISGTPVEIMQRLADRYALRCVALTRGAEGAILVRKDTVSHQAGVSAHVVDTVGAGDAFTATLALGMLEGRDLPSINRSACQVAAFVCSQPGATPKIPAELALGYR